jgi:antitoxin (DNA-binding transcriptional repressor) of toxin-antitoxin stability system
MIDQAPKAAAMEYALRDAKAHLSKLVRDAQNGERVVITKHGEPVVELVRCNVRGGLDFEKLEADRRRLGIKDATPEEAEAMIAAFHDPALSRRVLGLKDKE